MLARAIIGRLMKGCRAAALVLFGWYLMTPPLTPAPGQKDRFLVIIDAPLGKWDIESSHDTAKQCEEERGRISSALMPMASGKAKSPFTFEEATVFRGGSLVCISTDDPRLKEDTKH
jgi:hypothetical protein